jgi:hypothetical protein
MQQNFKKESYIFFLDSSNRNRVTHPHPSEHAIVFDEPFSNVFGIELLDAHVPTGDYMINENNNTIVFAIDPTGTLNMDNLTWYTCTVEIGNYSLNSELTDVIQSAINNAIQHTTIPDMTLRISYYSEDDPTRLMKFKFFSSHEFILDMKNSTMNTFLGFDEYAQEKHYDLYETVQANTQWFKSKIDGGLNIIVSPNIMYPHSQKYILLKCKEIEDHLFQSRSFQRNSPGLAKFNLSTQGDERDQRLDFTTVPVKEFHPIGKLTYLTFRFETYDGKLYNFNGLNHTLTFVIRYYVHPNVLKFESSVLNPHYDPNFLNWMNNNMYRLDYERQMEETETDSE